MNLLVDAESLRGPTFMRLAIVRCPCDEYVDIPAVCFASIIQLSIMKSFIPKP